MNPGTCPVSNARACPSISCLNWPSIPVLTRIRATVPYMLVSSLCHLLLNVNGHFGYSKHTGNAWTCHRTTDGVFAALIRRTGTLGSLLLAGRCYLHAPPASTFARDRTHQRRREFAHHSQEVGA